MLYRRQLDEIQFLGDVSPLIQEASSVLTNWRGVCRLLNSVWECPYRVAEGTCELQETETRPVAYDTALRTTVFVLQIKSKS